jgi:LacI family transcriptional regulator
LTRHPVPCRKTNRLLEENPEFLGATGFFPRSVVTLSPDLPVPAPSPGEQPSRAPTIKDVAKAAGVHFTTVSLALRDHPSLPASTKDRVRAVARQLGYAPNPVFSALTHFHLHGRVRAKAPRIAYLVNRPVDPADELSRLQSQFLDGARTQAQILGYDLELIVIGGAPFESLRLGRHLRDASISGIVIGAFDPRYARVTLDWDDYCVVKINSFHMEPAAPVFASDHRQEVRLAFQRLWALGYRRIGLAVGRADEDATENLHSAGFLLEQRPRPANQCVPRLLFPYDCPAAEASRLLGQWIRQHRVDAVLCNRINSDELIRAAGLRVPDDVACASLSLLDEPDALAGIFPNPRLVGAKAVSLLTTLLKSDERGVPQFASRTYVPSRWQEGASAPSRSRAAPPLAAVAGPR